MENILNFEDFKEKFTLEVGQNVTYEKVLDIAFKYYSNQVETSLLLSEHNKQLRNELQMIKLSNNKPKPKKKKVKLLNKTEKKYINNLIEVYGFSKEKTLLFFNEKFNKRDKKLTLYCLKEYLKNENIIKGSKQPK